MKPIIEVTTLEDPRLAPFAGLTDANLRSRLDPSQGVIIAESPKVIDAALDCGFQPISLLAERKHLEGDARHILDRTGDIDVFTGSRETLASLTGYKLTRGVLCAFRRPSESTVGEVLDGARRVVVIDGVCDTTNVGAIFRSAAALGIDGALVTPTACDPWNRRVVRVSMGTVFRLPWARLEGGSSELRDYGFKTVAMALRDNSVMLSDPALQAEPKLAIIMGTEGDGLDDGVIRGADYVVKIPMSRNVDSLNVAAASAVAFYALV